MKRSSSVPPQEEKSQVEAKPHRSHSKAPKPRKNGKAKKNGPSTESCQKAKGDRGKQEALNQQWMDSLRDW
uniref:Mortality factor 4-like protein 2 n=1 Tax=Steinernema glaseri TaxID=37863 RepID=A0A1I7YVS7_9BILA